MKRLLPITVVSGVAVLFLSGCCCSWCHRQSEIVSVPVPPPADINCPPGSTIPPIPVPVAPPGGLSTPPPPAAPTMPPPPPAFPNQPAASNFSPNQIPEDNWRPIEGRQVPQVPRYAQEPPPAYPPSAGQPYPPSDPSRQPPLARIQLSPPVPLEEPASPVPAAPGEEGGVKGKLEVPQPEPPYDPPQQPAYEPPQSVTPPPAPPGKENGSSIATPVGIPQFSYVKERVANGLRPSLDEGLDWLQRRGFRTVLYLRRPGDPENADRNQVEKRGMTFVTLEVSPNTLDENRIDDFFRIVRDTANYPLFVYDRDGALTGGLWYIYFRRIDNSSEDVARVRAGSLGFREDGDPAHREMWRAVRDLNNESP